MEFWKIYIGKSCFLRIHTHNIHLSVHNQQMQCLNQARVLHPSITTAKQLDEHQDFNALPFFLTESIRKAEVQACFIAIKIVAKTIRIASGTERQKCFLQPGEQGQCWLGEHMW